MNGLYSVMSRARAYGLGCSLCRGIILGPVNEADGYDTRLTWSRCDDTTGGWNYHPHCPDCHADLDLIAVE